MWGGGGEAGDGVEVYGAPLVFGVRETDLYWASREQIRLRLHQRKRIALAGPGNRGRLAKS